MAMINKTLKLSPDILKKALSKTPMRNGVGWGLIDAGKLDERVVVLTADLAESTRASEFQKEFPNRFFECGVAEQGMVTIASGMASYGKRPFALSFAAFSPGRNWEQIRTTICLNDVPVTIVGSHAGVTIGEDGATHQVLEDVALMRSLPHMTVIVPSDAQEAKKAVIAAAALGKPCYIRISRMDTSDYTTDETPFEIGKAVVLWEDKKPEVTIIAMGVMVYEALKAAKELSAKGIGVVVLNMHTVKPLDTEAITKYVRLTGAVVTAEEHQKAGGLGSAIAEYLAATQPVPQEFVGVDDRFGQSGKPRELLEEYKLTKEAIVLACKKAVTRKNARES